MERKPVPIGPAEQAVKNFKRLTKPSSEEHELKIKEIDEKIKRELEKKKDFANPPEQRAEREKMISEAKEKRAEQDEITKQIQVITSEKEKFWEQRTNLQTKRKEIRNKLMEQKRELKYKSEKEFNQRIKELEADLQSKSWSIKEERNMVAEINQLRRTKDGLKACNNTEADFEKQATDMETLNKQIQGKMEEANALRAKKRDMQQEIDQIYNRLRRMKEADTENRQKADECWEEIQRFRKEKDALFQERRQKMQEWVENKKELGELVRKAREEREEMQEKEFSEYIAEEEKEYKATLLVNPHVEKITNVENLIVYLRGLQPTETEGTNSADDAKEEVSDFKDKNGKMMQVLKKGDDEEFADSWYAGLGSVKKSKRKTKRQQRQQAAKKETGPSQIRHSLTTLPLFSEFKVNVPYTIDEIDDTVAQLDEKVEKMRKWQPPTEAEIEEKISKWKESMQIKRKGPRRDNRRRRDDESKKDEKNVEEKKPEEEEKPVEEAVEVADKE